MQGVLLARLPWGGARRWSVRWLLRQGLKLPCATVCATLSASLLTTPLVALYFRSVSLIAPLSNLLTLWAVGLLFGFGLVMGTVGVFLPIWSWLLLPGGVAGPVFERMHWAAVQNALCRSDLRCGLLPGMADFAVPYFTGAAGLPGKSGGSFPAAAE